VDGLKLLSDARRAGLTVRAEGDRLIVRGPATLADLAKQVLSRKADLMDALAIEASQSSPARLSGRCDDRGLRGTLADADEALGRYWYPSPGSTLVFQDESGRPCSAGEAYQWTWVGASSWFYARTYPIPAIAMERNCQ
jgi:hypothetical protein